MPCSSRTTTSSPPAASAPALERARAHAGHMVKVEIEVTNLDEVDEALQLDPDALLLDNMDCRRCGRR